MFESFTRCHKNPWNRNGSRDFLLMEKDREMARGADRGILVTQIMDCDGAGNLPVRHSSASRDYPCKTTGKR